MNETNMTININDSISYILNNIFLQQKSINENKDCSIIYISGPPGIGKSALIDQICKKNNFGLVVKYMGTSLIEQITGLPNSRVRDDGSTEWSLPELFSLQNLKSDYRKNKDDSVVLLLDDAHLCTKTIQAYMFQLLTYRSIHGHKLPNNVVLVLAGNRSTDRAGFQPILAPVSNRLHFLDVHNEVEDWAKNFAFKYGVRSDIITFLLYNTSCFQTEPLESFAWASPRSWTYASDSLDSFESINKLNIFNISQLQNILNGHVGTEKASEFIKYYQLFKKWNVKDILKEKEDLPDIKKISKNKIECYSLLSAVVSAMLHDLKENNIDSSVMKTEIKVCKKLLDELIENCKEIIAFGLKSFLNVDKPEKTILLRKILEKNEFLVDIMIEMTK